MLGGASPRSIHIRGRGSCEFLSCSVIERRQRYFPATVGVHDHVHAIPAFEQLSSYTAVGKTSPNNGDIGLDLFDLKLARVVLDFQTYPQFVPGLDKIGENSINISGSRDGVAPG